MDNVAKARLEAAGFRETSVSELLGLTPEESEWIETRLAEAQAGKCSAEDVIDECMPNHGETQS